MDPGWQRMQAGGSVAMLRQKTQAMKEAMDGGGKYRPHTTGGGDADYRQAQRDKLQRWREAQQARLFESERSREAS
eukprot:SAG22_NODE_18820_length_281_cov_0.571429_1_plen_75_part_01